MKVVAKPGRSSLRPAVKTAAAVLLLALGCGKGDDRTPIAGKATFSGKPIVFGTIEFLPDESKGHKGPAGVAEIQNGEFDSARNQSGIFPGPHIVRITGYEEVPVTSPDETKPSTSKPLFVEYSIPADIKGSPYDVDVPESAKGKDSSKPMSPARAQNIP